jgi:hypothetical protein
MFPGFSHDASVDVLQDSRNKCFNLLIIREDHHEDHDHYFDLDLDRNKLIVSRGRDDEHGRGDWNCGRRQRGK